MADDKPNGSGSPPGEPPLAPLTPEQAFELISATLRGLQSKARLDVLEGLLHRLEPGERIQLQLCLRSLEVEIEPQFVDLDFRRPWRLR